MDENFWGDIKSWLGEVGFNIFLWSKGWTEEEYIELLKKEYQGT